MLYGCIGLVLSPDLVLGRVANTGMFLWRTEASARLPRAMRRAALTLLYRSGNDAYPWLDMLLPFWTLWPLSEPYREKVG